MNKEKINNFIDKWRTFAKENDLQFIGELEEDAPVIRLRFRKGKRILVYDVSIFQLEHMKDEFLIKEIITRTEEL